jgi:hypothetical protein
MATYLAGLWIDEESLPGQSVWWLHDGPRHFPATIPHQHLHLVLSPATVFLKRQASAGFRLWPAMRISAWIQAKT